MKTPGNEMQLERGDMCLTGRLAGDDVPIKRLHAVNRYQDDMLYNWSKQKCGEGCMGTKRKSRDSNLSL